jgi:hypothetical protein
MDVGQVAKLERHLSLLRQEYVKLQNKLVDLEQKYSVAVAASGQTGEHDNTFVQAQVIVSDSTGTGIRLKRKSAM